MEAGRHARKPIETTPALYRFKGAASANKVTTLTVRRGVRQSETIAMLSADHRSAVARYSRTGEIPQSVRDAIAKAIQLRQAMIDAERGIATRTQQIARDHRRAEPDPRKHEDRRAEHAVLRTTAGKAERAGIDDRISPARSNALIAKRDAARKELDDYLNSLTID